MPARSTGLDGVTAIEEKRAPPVRRLEGAVGLFPDSETEPGACELDIGIVAQFEELKGMRLEKGRPFIAVSWDEGSARKRTAIDAGSGEALVSGCWRPPEGLFCGGAAGGMIGGMWSDGAVGGLRTWNVSRDIDVLTYRRKAIPTALNKSKLLRSRFGGFLLRWTARLHRSSTGQHGMPCR